MAARAIWKGVIEFEGVELPVKLYSAVEDQSIHFRLLHDQDLQPLKQRMVGAGHDEVEADEVRHGVEVGPDEYVVVSDEELEEIAPKESRSIKLLQFVPPEEINHQWYVRPYYLGPDGGDAEKDYFAFTEALGHLKQVGVARWVMRGKEYLGALRAEDGHLALITLRHAGEVIDASELEPPSGRELEPRELKMAEQLVDALTDRFDPTDYRDEYRERVLDVVRRKAKGEDVHIEPEPLPERELALSLADTLEKSLHAVKGNGHGKRKVKRG